MWSVNSCALFRSIHYMRSKETKDALWSTWWKKNSQPFISKVCISADSVPKQPIKPGNRRWTDSFATITAFIRYLFISLMHIEIFRFLYPLIYPISLLRYFKGYYLKKYFYTNYTFNTFIERTHLFSHMCMTKPATHFCSVSAMF